MSESKPLLVFLKDPRLSAYATGDVPAWLWSIDATRVLWGNPVAAAIFNAASSAVLVGHTIDPKGSAALQIARLAGTLPHGAAPRLERLRGFGGRMGGALLCSCSHVMLADRTPAILVVATEKAGPRLPLADQARRLLAGVDDEAVALFGADGTLLQATAAAKAKLGSTTSLGQLHAMPLMTAALTTGHAAGDVPAGHKVSIHRIGSEEATLLLATFERSAQSPELKRPAVDSAVEADATNIARRFAEPSAGSAPPRTAALHTLTERRQPLRFVWQMDADGRFTLTSDEFIALIGPKNAALLGRPWSEIAEATGLDPDNQVARAFASQETWSGMTVAFPVESTSERLPVELSGLPVFDRDRNFLGYRGFGICRATTRIAAAAKDKQPVETATIPPAEAPPAPRVEPPVFLEPQPAHPPGANVVPFPTVPADGAPTLTPIERRAFTEIGSRLAARLRNRDSSEQSEPPSGTAAEEAKTARDHTETADKAETAANDHRPAPPAEQPAASLREGLAAAAANEQRPILDRLPIGVLVYRLDRLIYANRAFLDWTGYADLRSLDDAGGLDALFVEPSGDESGASNGAQSLSIATNRGDQLSVAARLFTSPWEGESALVLMLTGVGNAENQKKDVETALRAAKTEAGELRNMLDTAIDGVVVLDRGMRVSSVSRSAETLFGYEHRELVGLPFTTLFARESQPVVLDALDRPHAAGTASASRTGRDVIGRRRDGTLVPVLMSVTRSSEGSDRLHAIFRDMTPWKKTESELLNAKRQAEKASAAKSDFLAKISHEIRTPLNAIIGFSEVMMQERFGPIGNERYRQYLKDIHASGGHLMSLLNDLLDLSKIEAGRLELNFATVDINEVTQQSVALMQPQANRERIIIRTALGMELPTVTADVRSVRQILLNLLSNSIKFTGAGGQVIVSTARNEDGSVVLRVRDTGVGMSEQDIAVALEPFRQLATSARWGSSGTGLGLPLSKALAEANRASFRIRSGVNAGTLVEVAFPGTRLAAE